VILKMQGAYHKRPWFNMADGSHISTYLADYRLFIW